MHFLSRALASLAAVALTACTDNSETAMSTNEDGGPVVFAAASLTDVLHTLGDIYESQGHPAPRFNFAGSSALARQLEQGGEADIFISADEAWMDYVAEKGLIDPATRQTLLSNTLVLVAPASAPFSLDLAPGVDLSAALKGGRLALAEPESVPAGRYAKQALEHLGAWAGVENSIVRAENVRAALRFVETGDAAAGIVYATDAQAAGTSVVVVATFPADSHTAITYPAALLAGKVGPAGQDFLTFLASDAARAEFQRAGFGPAP